MVVNNPGRGGLRTNTLSDLKKLQKKSQATDTVSSVASGPVPAGRTLGKKKRRKGALPTGPQASVVAPVVPVPKPVGPSGPVVSQEDLALFRSAVKSVKRIKDTQRIVLAPVRKVPAALLDERRARAAGVDVRPAPAVSDQYSPATLHHDDTQFVRDRHSPDLIRQLERRRWPIGASLDLHGSTLDEARERLDRFVQSCTEHYIRCVRIIHGKGYGSKAGESVLKTTLRRWLTQLPCVQAYVQCAENDGGAGAVLVLLAENTVSSIAD